MAKVDIISGFLGAGKTTLIKKLIAEAFKGEQLVLIENEFGEIGVDGDFMKAAGIQVNELNSGCICCSLVGDFGEALQQVVDQYHPDRIIIEPSGVGKLSDVIKAIQKAAETVDLQLNSATTVVDVTKAKVYMKNFGEFFLNQIEAAGTVVLSRTQNVAEEKLMDAVARIHEHNAEARVITTAWDDISGVKILEAIEHSTNVEDIMKNFKYDPEEEEHEHHHHHHDDEDEHEHHHHHDHDEDEDEHEHHHHHDHDEDEHEHHHHHDEDEHEHHHHDHDEDEHEHHHHHHEEDEGEGHHHHHYDENGVCSCGHHHHHHGHDADEVFTSWGRETAVRYDREALRQILEQLAVEEENPYGIILRAKGIVPDKDQKWMEFDLVPGEFEIRDGAADYTGKLCVIGSQLKEEKLASLFGI
ncbi:MAG: GTP-binding protein [Eubacterium sp.]|nr:GTP-binding protein [Eubacterium sp.]